MSILTRNEILKEIGNKNVAITAPLEPAEGALSIYPMRVRWSGGFN